MTHSIYKTYVDLLILMKLGKSRTLIGVIAEKKSRSLLRHPNWFATLVEGMIEVRSGRGRLRQEYMGKIKERRRYVELKRLSMEGKKLKSHQPLDWGEEINCMKVDNNKNNKYNTDTLLVHCSTCGLIHRK